MALTKNRKFLGLIFIGSGLLVLAFQNCSSSKFQVASLTSEHPSLSPESSTSVMSDFKLAACMTLGLLDPGTEDQSGYFDFVQRSSCRGLQRSVDTWFGPTNFQFVASSLSQLKARLGDRPMHYGAFIGEIVYTSGFVYRDSDGLALDPLPMCRRDDQGQINQAFGSGTCIPDLSSSVFQKWLMGEIGHLMDLGFQDFQFGQTQLTDPQRAAPQILDQLRKLAKAKGLNVIFGAQTNDDLDEGYLRAWDYVSGGLGLLADGSIEDRDCGSVHSASETPGSNFCWALLWRDRFRNKANNVILTLDWFNDPNDEVHFFSRLSESQRNSSLNQIYNKMRALNVGYSFTIRAPLSINQSPGGRPPAGCSGYSPLWLSMINYPGDGHCNHEAVMKSLISQ